MSFFDYSQTHADFFVQHGQKVDYKKNRYLVTALDENPWVYFLTSGTVQASFVLIDGDTRLLGYFIPGMTFAKSGSFFSDSGGDIEYRAIENTVVYRIKRQLFLRQLKQDVDFAEAYRSMILKNQILLIDRIVYQGEKTIERKFLRWLLFMAKYYGTSRGASCYITIPTRQEDIANFLHTTRVSISKALQDLIAQQLISVQKRHITIHNLQDVRKLLD